jgi:NADH:ubiquinone oxidoreductase subunit F (NADH-binding)
VSGLPTQVLAVYCPTGDDPELTVRVTRGVHLLDGVLEGPSLAAHRDRFGEPPLLTVSQLLGLLDAVTIRGRGGAGFPFATKLRATADARGGATVVVNAGEGEPASFKDAVLALARPHLILDGAAIAARALFARTVHVVVPSDRPGVTEALQRALAERRRRDRPLRWVVHTAAPRFVAGQARAVIELMSGRENLPVTSWQPEAVKGYRGRPTLLSNAETFAQVALVALAGVPRYRRHGTAEEPGTMLVTLHGTCGPRVLEVAHGTPWSEVLPAETLARPVLVGGYHGAWTPPDALGELPVSRTAMAARGLALGAGAVLPLAPGDCPLDRTARITDYLASQSAGRCGPCLNGLPALADAVWDVANGVATTGRVHELARLVARRGACAHPDGTIRMVESLLAGYPDEVETHARGRCSFRGSGPAPSHLVDSHPAVRP